MWKKTGRLIVLILMLACLQAEEIILNTAVDNKNIPVNQTVQYTISVEGSVDLPGLNLPALTDFVVVGQSSSTQIQIINGRQSSSRSYIFTLQPKHEGKAVIPGLKFEYNKQVFRTDPVELDVTGYVTPNNTQSGSPRNSPFTIFNEDNFFNLGGTPPAGHPAQEVIAELSPDKKSLYVGEKTLLEFKLYYEHGFYQGPVYNPPKLEGFVVKNPDNNAPKPESIEYKNKKFNLQRIVQEIYPLDAGNFAIGSAQVQYLDSPFSEVKTLTTAPRQISVKELPQPQPDDFSGAVGAFNLAVDFKPKLIVQAGEVIPLNITVYGRGNLDMVNELNLALTENLKIYLDGLDTKETKGLFTKRTYKYFLTPLVSGKQKLADLEFSYFDPEQHIYKKLSYTFPVLTVKGVAAGASGNAGGLSSLSGQDDAISIRLDRRLLNTLAGFFKNVLAIVIFLGIMLLLAVYIFRQLLSPRRLLVRRYRNLASADFDQPRFIQESHDLLRELARLKYRINLAGLPISEIESKLTDSVAARLMTELEKKYEELKFTGVLELKAEDKTLILVSLKQLI